MQKFRTAIISALILVLASVSAQAFTVDLDGNNATGINNLDIGGTAYDVTFEFVQASTANGPTCAPSVPCDIFFGNETAADAAANAINAALNSTVAVSVGSTSKNSFFVPWAAGGGNIDASQGTTPGLPGAWQFIGASLDSTDLIEYARFTPAVIPVPAAVWLFGSALGLLGWIRRRSSNQV